MAARSPGQRSSVRRSLLWSALAASLGAGLLFVLMRVALPSDGARVSFYEGGWSPTGVRISPIDAPVGGLRGGDVVRSIDGSPLEAWLQSVLDPGRDRPAAGASIAYLVERDAAETTVAVTWGPPSMGSTLLAGWSVILFSLATAAIAAFVFARRPDEPSATALMIAACGAVGSSVPWFLGLHVSDIVEGVPFVLHALVTGPLYMLLWPAGVHLALVFPRPVGFVERHRWAIPAVYALALGAYGLITLAAAAMSSGAMAWVGTWPLTQVAIVVPTLAATIALFAARYLRTGDPALRAWVRLASLGVVASGALGLGLFMGPQLMWGRSLLPDAAIGVVAMPLPMGFAAGILRNRLFDIDAAINRTLVYGTLTIAVLAVYAAATSVIGSLVGNGSGYGVSLLATGLTAVLALPLRDALQRGVNRMMYGQRDEPWQAMHRLGTRLEWAADPGGAFPAVAETVAEALRLPYVAVEIADEAGRRRVVAAHGSAVRAAASFPLVHGAETVGWLVLGVRSGERDFRPAELELLRDLGRQAGAAIHAQRLRDELRQSRDRLVVAREEERRRLRRDLHDGLGPSLAAIGMRAEAAGATLPDDPEAGRRQLEALSGEIRVALADLRRLVDGLRPPALDELGLVGAIIQQAARLDDAGDADPGGLRTAVDSEPSPVPELPAAVEVAAYRIAVEAVTNAARHAGARNCRVRLRAGTHLTIEITDDGRGIPADPRAGTGLESMRERVAELGGELTVQPVPGGGTRVVARLPLGQAAAS